MVGATAYDTCSAAATEEDSSVCTTLEDLSTEETDSDRHSSQGRYDVVGRLRATVGLPRSCVLRPAARPFKRLAAAQQRLEELVEVDGFAPSHLGIFASDLGSGGAKCWYVDTFAGFALTNSPPTLCAGQDLPPKLPDFHSYEVFLEGRPCWLYFDLEYSIGLNPDLEPRAVTAAFHGVFSSFCTEELGAEVDDKSVYELDSTSAVKYSKHVIVKHLSPMARIEGGVDVFVSNLAFRTNAQAGCLVKRFVEYARAMRDKDPSSPAALLFARGAVATAAAAVSLGGAADRLHNEVPIVDESVYSRNRCFRVLFSSKQGKRLPLQPCWSSLPGRSPAEQLLHSLASFVPEGTALLKHPDIPEDAGVTKNAPRLRRDGAKAGSPKSGAKLRQGRFLCAKYDASSPIVQHVVNTWDRVRECHEPLGGQMQPTHARPLLTSDDKRFLVITLMHNRFCFCKGASHKSNGIYLVVDCAKSLFYQKCHDIDCKGFRSCDFLVPLELLPPLMATALSEAGDKVTVRRAANERWPIELCSTPERRRRAPATERSDFFTPSPPKRVRHF